MTPSIYMDNTDTLYLGDQHCLVRNCWFLFFPSVPVCQWLSVCNINGSVIFKGTGFQSRSIVFKIAGWLQGRLNLTSFRGRAQVISENSVVESKLLSCSGSVVLRQLNPSIKRGHKIFNWFKSKNCT